MRRRLLLAASFASLLVACASILGDFDVAPAGSNPDGSADGSSSSGEGGSSGGTDDSGTEGGSADQSPIGLQVATSTSASCATVQYPSGKKVTYCWGAQGAKYPFATVGANQGDPNVDGFFRPRLPTAETKYLTFSILTGAGTGEWFVGKGTDGQTTATYAWGSNDTGECAAGSGTTPVMPTVMKFNSTLLQFDTIYAAPNHGCMVQNLNFFCWGNDTNCEIRSGATTTCNTIEQPVLSDKNAYAVEDEGQHASGKGVQVLRMAGGLDHSCRQVKSSDTGVDAMDELSCWGSNAFAQVDISTAPTFVDAPTTIMKVKRATSEIAAGENHTCAILDLTRIACWGRNDSGQSNPANPSPRVKPTEVANVAGGLSTLRAAGDLSCVVAKPAGQPSHAFCWGNGPKGRAAADADLPVGKVAGIQDVTALAIGRAHACAVAKKEGAKEKDPAHVWCWGTNDFKRVDPRSAVGPIAQPIEIQFPPEPAN
jgi:hypothetical protein